MSGPVGDNVFRASGVIAAAAAGRTGTVDWVTTPKVTGDSPITAVTGEGYFLNTTAGAITINLPAGVAGSIVSMADYAATWQTNNVTVVANGSEKIGGNEDDATLDTIGQSVTFVYVDATQGWVNTMDSTSNVRGAPPYIVATGGTITCSGNDKIHTFQGPGTFCVSKGAACAADNAVSYVIVAGGGAGGDGGTGEGGGGGGAGGFREGSTVPIVPYTVSPLAHTVGITVSCSPGAYSITVGGGGTPGVVAGDPAPTPVGVNGTPSTGLGLTSAGGGFGTGGGAHSSMGGTGGSGGGGNARCGPGTPGNRTGQAGNTPPVSPPQGNTGGNGCGSPARGGGGGGATAVGGNTTTPTGGVGGAGATTCISATPTAYAGGGGGGNQGGPGPSGGAGGTGGGGNGGKNQVGVPGTDYTGGGGGGNSCGSNWPPTGNGGIGGSGVVIIRYRFQ